MSEYIKREDAIKAFEQWKEPQVLNEQDDVWNRGIDCCINEVKHHVPSADVVEVKHGHWKDAGADLDGEWYYQCSVCGGEAVNGHEYSLCPWCGAKMDGERNDGERTIFIDETIDETCGYGEDGESE